MGHPPLAIAGDSAVAGEAYLADTPVLRGHAGTQPDLFLRWNGLPLGGAIDVVVHLHGFSQQGGAMTLAEKVARSGLDLARRARPTLAVLPRGNWLRHTYYDFPALQAGGLDALVDHALACLGRDHACDRLILTAHSGGVMPALDIVAQNRQPDELHLYDGLYGRDPALPEPGRDLPLLGRWLAARIAAEPARPGALRVVYIERQTGAMSRAAAALIARHIEAAGPPLAALLSPRYRVEPSAVPHGYVAAVCGPELLADPGTDLDWPRIV